MISETLVLRNQKDGWKLLVFPEWREMFCRLEDVRRLLAHPENIIQENDRGTVSLIRYQERRFIAKRSLIQERRRWTQFTSLYRKGEGRRTLHYMANMKAAGLLVPEPVLVLEQVRCGFVVASWSMYRYLEGEPCTCAESHRAAQALRAIHQQGWVHRDVHIQNFLQQGEDIYMIDCSKARPWNSEYARMYDVVRLNNCCPGSLKEYGISETYWVYRLAKCHNTCIKGWRTLKRTIRAFFRSTFFPDQR